jgi:centriolar protein POC1
MLNNSKLLGISNNKTTSSKNRVQSYYTDPTLLRSFRGHKDKINSVLFSPNMKQVISGSDDGDVILWNFKPQMRPYKFIGHKGAINEVAINPSGSLLASASSDQTVRLWSNTM